MRVDSINNSIYFSGYDARPLRGFLMNSNYKGIASELASIGEKHGFDVFFIDKKAVNIVTDKLLPDDKLSGSWAQDFWSFTRKGFLFYEDGGYERIIRDYFNIKNNTFQNKVKENLEIPLLSKYLKFLKSIPLINRDGLEYAILPDEMTKTIKLFSKDLLNSEILKTLKNYKELMSRSHVAGGNFFIVKGKGGKDELIVGSKELSKFSQSELKKMYGVKNIHILPQMDFHLDMFIRPLDNGRILVADDKKVVQLFQKGIQSIYDYTRREYENAGVMKTPFLNLGAYLFRFKKIIENNPLPDCDSIVKKLESEGFIPIRVPGRFYQLSINKSNSNSQDYLLTHFANFINSNVIKNKNGELVYITNKSVIDRELGLTPEI